MARRALAVDFARTLVDRYGIVADVAVHAPHPEGDSRNHHAHILTTTRQVGPDGFEAKTRVLDVKKTASIEVTTMREQWADRQNQALERANAPERVDHRSLSAQRAEAEAQRDRLEREVAARRASDMRDRIRALGRSGRGPEVLKPETRDRQGVDQSKENRDCTSIESRVHNTSNDLPEMEKRLLQKTLEAEILDWAPEIKLGLATVRSHANWNSLLKCAVLFTAAMTARQTRRNRGLCHPGSTLAHLFNFYAPQTVHHMRRKQNACINSS